MGQVPRLPVHQPVACRRCRADCDSRRGHDRRGRQRQRRQAARPKARQQNKLAGEDRNAHRQSVRRTEKRCRPAGSHEQHECAPDGLPRRRQQRDEEREDEDGGEDEVGHRGVHTRVEREVRAVEVREAVPETGPHGGIRVRVNRNEGD